MKYRIRGLLALIFFIVALGIAGEDDFQQALASEAAHEHFQR
jgi:hypothetical protein